MQQHAQTDYRVRIAILGASGYTGAELLRLLAEHPNAEIVTLTADHLLASGSLPPGFPITVIDGVPYWDGGLFDDTPIEPLLDLLDDQEIDELPIFIVDLFATNAPTPLNLAQVLERVMEISYESRFLMEHADANGSLLEFTSMLEELARELPRDSPVRARESFRRLLRMRALKNIKVIEADHAPMTHLYSGHQRFSGILVPTLCRLSAIGTDAEPVGKPALLDVEIFDVNFA